MGRPNPRGGFGFDRQTGNGLRLPQAVFLWLGDRRGRSSRCGGRTAKETARGRRRGFLPSWPRDIMDRRRADGGLHDARDIAIRCAIRRGDLRSGERADKREGGRAPDRSSEARFRMRAPRLSHDESDDRERPSHSAWRRDDRRRGTPASFPQSRWRCNEWPAARASANQARRRLAEPMIRRTGGVPIERRGAPGRWPIDEAAPQWASRSRERRMRPNRTSAARPSAARPAH